MELKLLDSFKLTHRLTTNFACQYSEDDKLFIITDTGVYILTLKGYITNPFPNLNRQVEFFKVSSFDATSNVGLDINSFHRELPREDFYESVLRTDLSANLNNSTPLDTFPISAEWSPRGLVGECNCLLGVLTNISSLEVYVKVCDENELGDWVLISNVTQEIINVKKKHFSYPDKLSIPLKWNEYKRRIESVRPTAFTWSHKYLVNGISHVVLFVGLLDGSIIIFRLTQRKTNVVERSQLFYLGSYNTQLKHITSLHWRQTKTFAGGLSFGNMEGKFSVLNVNNLDQDNAAVVNEISFWDEADGVRVDKISVMDFQNYTYILVVKQSFVIIYGIDDGGCVFDQKIFQAANLYITGIHHYDNILLILTLTGVCKQLTLTVINKKINIEETNVNIKIDFSRNRTHGFFFTKNKLLLGVLVYPSRLSNVIVGKQFVNIFIFHNSQYNPFDLLMSNNTGSLREFWDCFETLRLICLKEKRFPWEGIDPDLNYDDLSLLQLKTLRWIAKLSEEMFTIVPKITNYDIKPFVLLHYLVDIKLAVGRINKLLNLRNYGVELSNFQMQSVDVQNFFLKEMVAKNILPKANVGENFINDVYHVMQICNELRYPQMPQCLWCGEKIIGLTCIPPHIDSRCSISMMPINLVPGYKCPYCKSVAHKEMGKEYNPVLCPYCDIPMEQRFFPQKIKAAIALAPDFKIETEKAFGLNASGEVVSSCFEDCLKDEISFSDVEENTSDYLLFSDSDGEDEEERGKLTRLYMNLAKVSLEEVVDVEGDKKVDEGGGSGAKLRRKSADK